MKTTIILDLVVKKFVDIYIDRSLYDIFIFGSRAKWNSTQTSDRDIWLLSKDGQKIPFCEYTRICWLAYDLPIKVDILDFARADQEFIDMNKSDRIYI